MKQLIRNNTFETNSSSMHAISVMQHMNPDDLNELNYHIEFGEYGWEHMEYNTPYEILTYLWTLAHCGDVHKCKDYQTRIKEWCPNCTFKEAKIKQYEFGNRHEYFDIDGYIDHSGDYDSDAIFKDKERFADIVLGGIIRTDNDNCYDYEETERWLEPHAAIITFYKGN